MNDIFAKRVLIGFGVLLVVVLVIILFWNSPLLVFWLVFFPASLSLYASVKQRQQEQLQGMITPWYKHSSLIMTIGLFWFAGRFLVDALVPDTSQPLRGWLDCLFTVGLAGLFIYVAILWRRNEKSKQKQNLQ